MQLLSIPKRSIDELEDHIISLSSRLNQAEYEFLVAIREFDLRQGWRLWEFNNCAQWLNFKCGISEGTGREKVRVAKQLFDLPKLSEAFEKGDLSYSKARALTRVATPANEAELLDYAVRATASSVEEKCRRMRNAQKKESTKDANQMHAERCLFTFKNDQGGVSLSGELPPEIGALLMQALHVAMEDLPETEKGEETPFQARQVDAFARVLNRYLSGGLEKEASTSDNYQVMIHVDEKALNAENDEVALDKTSELPVETVKRVCCDASVTKVIKDKTGNLLELSRKRRVVSPQLKKALVARDQHCRYPGCTHTKWLDAHHVMHWADGGETTPDNLLLLCDKHHRRLHEGGYRIKQRHDGRFYFVTNRGRVIVDEERSIT